MINTDSFAKLVIAFGDSLLKGESTRASSSRLPAVAACDSGTFLFSVTKSGSRLGLDAGDSLLIIFSNCSFSGLVFNGSMRLTAQGNISNVSSAYNIRYLATMTNWSVRNGSLTTTTSGNMDINSSNTAIAFTVPTNQSVTSASTVSSGTVTSIYRAGTTALSVDTISPNTASRKLDGTVVVSTSSGQLTFDVATPTAFAGTTSGGRFEPNTGAMTFRQPGGTSNASISISGNTATVSGDTDGNGTPDLSFTTTWAALTL
ncbi:MAG: hypothetical protein HEQ39_11815 [Rhizobacter sp.]